MEKATTALFRIQRLPAATRRCERTQRVRDDVAVAVAVAVAVGGGGGGTTTIWARNCIVGARELSARRSSGMMGRIRGAGARSGRDVRKIGMSGCRTSSGYLS